MKWKEEALERLERYTLMEQARRNIPRELERLEAEAEAMGKRDLTRVGRSAKKHDEWLLNNLALRQQLEWSLQDAVSWLGITNVALNALEKEERWLLENLIIKKQITMAELECRLGVERSTAYRRRDKALEHFALALYGGIES